MHIALPTPDLILPNGAAVWLPETLVQGTEEWLQARSGQATASEMECLLVNPKDPKKAPYGLAAGAITYAHTVAAEVITGGPVKVSFENEHTRRGHAKEAEFRELYEFMHDAEVKEIGFVRAAGFGYSPDGFVGEDGLYEGKAPGAGKLVGFLRDPGFPKEYKAQALAGLLATGRAWIDLNAGADGLPLCTRRLWAEEAQKDMAALVDAIARFNAYVAETVAFIREIAGTEEEAVAIAEGLPIAAE